MPKKMSRVAKHLLTSSTKNMDSYMILKSSLVKMALVKVAHKKALIKSLLASVTQMMTSA